MNTANVGGEGTSDVWGIDNGYVDVSGLWRPLADESRTALRAAMRCDEERPPAGPPLWFVPRGDTPRLQGPRGLELELEDGTALGTVSELPPDLPIGWHRLTAPDGGPATTLAVHPPRVAAADGLRAWMWSAQLYATRSARSWGIGDLGDLATLCRLGHETGASLLGLNPLFDARTDPTCEPSPYSPSSRRWLHPIYLRIEDVPGAVHLRDIDALARAGRDLNARRLIDRDAIWALKRAALEQLWVQADTSADHQRFRRWRTAQGAPLETYARFRAIAELHGEDWRRWPAALRSPASIAVADAAAELAERVGFWAWVQWLLDRQIATAHRSLPLLADLPVGVDPGGVDAWRWQHLLAADTHIGAPPDALGPAGQDWGVAPFIPWALRAARYEPLVDMVRGICANAGALRIDHVMGLLRLFWIPEGSPPSAGGYVRFPGTELLDVVLLEAARSDTIVVGEDLGTVEPGVRELLADRRVLGTRLVWFEDAVPAEYPESCMASISTHDLPTVAGMLTGADTADVRAAGAPVDEAAAAAMRERLLRAAASAPSEPTGPSSPTASPSPPDPADVTCRTVAALADSPAALVAVSLDDAVGATARPNVPGTTSDQRSNWSIPLPVAIEQLADHPVLQACAATLRAARPQLTS